MTEQELIELGFNREDEFGIDCSDDQGSEWVEDAFYYYSLDLVQGLDLITGPSDEECAKNNEWYVELFDTYPTVRFTDAQEVKTLIELLKSGIVADVSTMSTEQLIDSVLESDDSDE